MNYSVKIKLCVSKTNKWLIQFVKIVTSIVNLVIRKNNRNFNWNLFRIR